MLYMWKGNCGHQSINQPSKKHYGKIFWKAGCIQWKTWIMNYSSSLDATCMPWHIDWLILKYFKKNIQLSFLAFHISLGVFLGTDACSKNTCHFYLDIHFLEYWNKPMNRNTPWRHLHEKQCLKNITKNNCKISTCDTTRLPDSLIGGLWTNCPG